MSLIFEIKIVIIISPAKVIQKNNLQITQKRVALW